MIVVPDSDIILIKSPLKLDNYNQITFGDATAQYNYFHGLTHLEYDDCTYQRKDGVIRYATGDNLRFEDLLQYNYCMYKNDSYKDKWFYAFITDIKYINDGMTEITIETDTYSKSLTQKSMNQRDNSSLANLLRCIKNYIRTSHLCSVLYNS